jgi:hypothetical protein
MTRRQALSSTNTFRDSDQIAQFCPLDGNDNDENNARLKKKYFSLAGSMPSIGAVTWQKSLLSPSTRDRHFC